MAKPVPNQMSFDFEQIEMEAAANCAPPSSAKLSGNTDLKVVPPKLPPQQSRNEPGLTPNVAPVVPPATLADVFELISARGPLKSFQDMRAALSTVGRVLGRPLSAIPADPLSL